MDIVNIGIRDVKINKANPRTIRDTKFNKLVDSLLVFPEMLHVRPIVVSKDMTCLGGNMRARALIYIAGLEESDVIKRLKSSNGYGKKSDREQDDLEGYWLKWLESPTIPVVIADSFTDGQAKEFIIKDNSDFGEWDWDMLANEWDEEDLEDWGVNVNWENIDDTSTSGGATGGGVSEDDFEEGGDNIEPVVKLGEIWQCGEHIIMCGDSSDAESVKKLLGGVKADMVFTDPPYGVAIGDKNRALNSVQKAGRCTQNIENDTLSADELYPILVKAMTNARENCKEDACYYVTSPQGGELGLMMMMMKDAGLPVRHMLIWEKNSATFSLGRLDYDYQHEPIFYTWTKKHHNYRKGEYRTTIWKYDKPRKCDLHPTMKPVALVANCLMDGTQEGDIVLDLFGGSGTTMIACEQLGRKSRIMELDPHYCDVMIARWEKITGKKAVKMRNNSR